MTFKKTKFALIRFKLYLTMQWFLNEFSSQNILKIPGTFLQINVNKIIKWTNFQIAFLAQFYESEYTMKKEKYFLKV